MQALKQTSFLDSLFQTQVPAPIPKRALDAKNKASWLPITKSALLAGGTLIALGGIYLAYQGNPTTISTPTIITPASNTIIPSSSYSSGTFAAIILGSAAIGYAIFNCTRKNTPAQGENITQKKLDHLPSTILGSLEEQESKKEIVEKALPSEFPEGNQKSNIPQDNTTKLNEFDAENELLSDQTKMPFTKSNEDVLNIDVSTQNSEFLDNNLNEHEKKMDATDESEIDEFYELLETESSEEQESTARCILQ